MDLFTRVNEQNQGIIKIGENGVKYIFVNNVKKILNGDCLSIIDKNYTKIEWIGIDNKMYKTNLAIVDKTITIGTSIEQDDSKIQN